MRHKDKNEPSAKCLCCHLHPNTILAGWAAMKIIIDLGSTAFMIYCMLVEHVFYPYFWGAYIYMWPYIHGITTVLVAIMSVVDIVFMAILCNGIDDKDARKLRAVYYYCFVLFALGCIFNAVMFILLTSYLDKMDISTLDVVTICFICFNFLLLIRIILLLRNEITRMQGLNMLINSPPPNRKGLKTMKPFQADEDNDYV